MGMPFFLRMVRRLFKELKVIMHKYVFTLNLLYDIIISSQGKRGAFYDYWASERD